MINELPIESKLDKCDQMMTLLQNTEEMLKGYLMKTWDDLKLTYSEVMILSIVNNARLKKQQVHKSQVAKQLNLSKPAVTQFCNKLKSRGFIECYLIDGNTKNHYLKITKTMEESVESRCFNMQLHLQHFIDTAGDENISLITEILDEFKKIISRLMN